MFIISNIDENIVNKIIQIISGRQINSKTYKGIKIYNLVKSNFYYISGNKNLYFSNNIGTIKSYIKEFLIKHDSTLKNNKKFETASLYLEEDRHGSVIVTDHSIFIDKANNIFKNFSEELKLFFDIPDFTAASIKRLDDRFEIFAHSKLSSGSFSDKKQPFQKLFNKKNRIGPFKMPEATVTYLQIANAKDLLDLFIEIKGLKKKEEYKISKEFLKEYSKIDLEKDLLPAFANPLTLLHLKTVANNENFVAIMPYTAELDRVMDRLLKLSILFLPSADYGKTTYKNNELTHISIPGRNISFCIGKLPNETYIFGEKSGVEYMIDFAEENLKMEPGEEIQLQEEFKAYINLEKARDSKYIGEHLQKIPNQLRNRIQSVKISANADDKEIKSFIELSLKGN